MLYGKHCLRFFSRYLLPQTTLCATTGALSGLTGSGFLNLTGYPNYNPVDFLKVGAVGGTSIGVFGKGFITARRDGHDHYCPK